jgi:hypothetical protein
VSEGICPECGNLLRDGRCLQCDANQFGRDKRWRTGDRGGKRPERRQTQRTLLDALDGTWRNAKHHITVYINVEENSYRSVHGRSQDTIFPFRFVNEQDNTIQFYKSDVLIEATVLPSGYLRMSALNKTMTFVYIYDEEMYRTCPCCFGKTPVEYDACGHCHQEFDEIV